MARFEKGTKIQVRITGRVGDKPPSGMLSTTAVTQTGNGGWLHYLYLASNLVTGDKGRDGTVRAEFDAEVTGEFETGRESTTTVREIVRGRPVGYTHFLYLDSPEITVITDDKPAPAAVGSGNGITSDRVSISSSDVTARIAALSLGGFDVVRLRNDEVLSRTPFSTLDEAKQFIDKEDYDPGRVAARKRELTADETGELTSLRNLAGAVTARIGERPWTVYGEGYFTVRWARGEVSDELDVSFGALDAWPFNLLNWNSVAEERRDSAYPNTYSYRGALFYGDDL